MNTPAEKSSTNRFSASRLIAWMGMIVFVLSSAYAVGYAFYKPVRNWDMVAYVGSAIAWGEKDPSEIHRRTLEDIKPVIWDWYYKQISEENQLSNDPAHFFQALPFYQVKPFYVGTVWLMHQSGLTSTYAQATWVVSALCFAVMAGLILLWKPEQLNRGLWLLAVVALYWLGPWPLASLAWYSTPDAMATLFLFAGVAALLSRRWPVAGILLLVLAVLARPDTLLMALMIAAGSFLLPREDAPLSPVQALVLGGAAFAAYAVTQHLAGSYGYTKLFSYTFIQRVPNPVEVEAHLTLEKYFRVLMRNIPPLLKDVRLIVLAVLSVIAAFAYWMRPAAKRIYPWLLVLAWGNFVARYALYPAWWEYRYYYINNLMVMMACAEMIPPYACVLWQRIKQHKASINNT